VVEITLKQLQERHDFGASSALVAQAVEGSLGDGESLLRFLGRYISWNGHFGNGVASLVAKIGRGRQLFTDRDEPIHACADRAVHVASFFFDAARDEFDDSATPHRDTHRTLAQATVRGVAEYYGLVDRANELLEDPAWLVDVNEGVHRGYGEGTPKDVGSIFEAMGFHLGSEILADEEFTLIDKTLRARLPELVEQLLSHRVEIADQLHPAYYWIGIHSSLGGGVEMDHFEAAIQGIQQALGFTDPSRGEDLLGAALRGFDRFAENHTTFFSSVLS
jgi:hypothetical protein